MSDARAKPCSLDLSNTAVFSPFNLPTESGPFEYVMKGRCMPKASLWDPHIVGFPPLQWMFGMFSVAASSMIAALVDDVPAMTAWKAPTAFPSASCPASILSKRPGTAVLLPPVSKSYTTIFVATPSTNQFCPPSVVLK